MFCVINSLFFSKEKVGYVTYQLTKLLGVDVTESSLLKSVVEHPDYPSMLCISDSLRKYGIDTYSIRLKTSNIKQIQTPYIAQLKIPNIKKNDVTLANDLGENSLYFSTVKPISDDTIEYFDPFAMDWKRVDIPTFEILYNGVVLIPNPRENAGEKNFLELYKRDVSAKYIRYFLLWGATIALIALLLINLIQDKEGRYIDAITIFLYGIGAFICALLMKLEFDEQDSPISNICEGKGSVDCNKVLQSQYSKVFGIPLSVLGLSYFLGSLLFNSILIASSEAMILSGWLSSFSILFTLFSIYYQKFIIKTWCTLCLLIQAVLVSIFLMQLINGFNFNFAPRIYTIVSALFCFLVFLTMLLILTNLLKSFNEVKESRMRLHRVLGNVEFFQALLVNQKKIANGKNDVGVLIGSPNARNKIVKVSSPYCAPCSKSHLALDELISTSEDISLRIIFLTSNDPEILNHSPVEHFLDIHAMGDQKLLRDALNEWYGGDKRDYNEFVKKFPKNNEKDFSKELNEMSRWCTDNEITFTPTIFCNNYQLPGIYSSNDLGVLIS